MEQENESVKAEQQGKLQNFIEEWAEKFRTKYGDGKLDPARARYDFTNPLKLTVSCQGAVLLDMEERGSNPFTLLLFLHLPTAKAERERINAIDRMVQAALMTDPHVQEYLISLSGHTGGQEKPHLFCKSIAGPSDSPTLIALSREQVGAFHVRDVDNCPLRLQLKLVHDVTLTMRFTGIEITPARQYLPAEFLAAASPEVIATIPTQASYLQTLHNVQLVGRSATFGMDARLATEPLDGPPPLEDVPGIEVVEPAASTPPPAPAPQATTECAVCMCDFGDGDEQVRRMVLIPCGHAHCCAGCVEGPPVLAECPECRAAIENSFPVYF